MKKKKKKKKKTHRSIALPGGRGCRRRGRVVHVQIRIAARRSEHVGTGQHHVCQADFLSLLIEVQLEKCLNRIDYIDTGTGIDK